MSQNGKRKASSEDNQGQSNKRQRLGEQRHPGTGINAAVLPNVAGHTTTTLTTVPANVTGQSDNTTRNTIVGQATIGVQANIAQTTHGRAVDNAARVGGAVQSNEPRALRPDTSSGAKRKRRASSPASEEPDSEQSARGQKRAGLQEPGLNDKERGTVQERNGQLYCMHPVDQNWVPAVFHNAIRAELIAAASTRGSYSVERAKGALDNDETSYLESQRDWSGERQHWTRIRHNVLNRHERNGWRDDYHGQRAQVWIHTDGRMVIDHDRNPMYRHPDLPDTLSSAIEGWYLEAVMRLDNRILRETIRARLPDVRRPPKSRTSESEGMYALSAISNKRLRFRNDEGLVAWSSRRVSTEKNDYFRSFIPQSSLDRNSNEGGRTLDKAERDHAENLGKGKEGDANRRGTASSNLTTPDQATTITPMTTESEGVTPAQASRPAHRGSMLPRAGSFASPSPLVHNNGQLIQPHNQAARAVDTSPLPFLLEEGFRPNQAQHFEPIPSAFNQGTAAPHTTRVEPPLPAYLNGASLTGSPSSAPIYNGENQLVRQPQQYTETQRLQQSMNRFSTSASNETPAQTNTRTARAGRSGRGRARWRNDDPPVYNATALRPNGGLPAGHRSIALEISSGPTGPVGHIGTPPAPANAATRGMVAYNVGTTSWNDSTVIAGNVPPFSNTDGNGRARGPVQQPTSAAQETPLEGSTHVEVEDGQQSGLDDSAFVLDDGWPTALDLELLGFIQSASSTVDQNSSGNGLENASHGTLGQGSGPSNTDDPINTRNGPGSVNQGNAGGQGSGPQVFYDGSAPLRDGQQNSVWRLDENDNWVLDQEHEQAVRGQLVIASNDTGNLQPPADTDGSSLATTRTSPQLHEAGETATSIRDARVASTPAAPRLSRSSPSPTPLAPHQPTMPRNDTTLQTESSHNASSPQNNIPSTTRAGDAQPTEEIGPHNAVPTNNFQYATIQNLLEPTRRHFMSAFQDEAWRSYVPRNFVPPTDRSLSYMGVFEQLSVDFWQIWTSRFGAYAEVPSLALPSEIDEFSAAVLMGFPE